MAGESNPYYVDPNQNLYSIAQKLIRAQFENWQSFFKPIELQAMDQLSFNNPSVLSGAISQAKEAATGSFQGMQRSMDIENQALGIKPTAQQAKASNRVMNIDEATAITGAENKARAQVRAQDQQILLGGMPNPNIVKAPMQTQT